MEQYDKYEPLQFIRLFDAFNVELKNPNYESESHLNSGITNTGRFYSVEVLFEMLLTISTTYGRLAYKQDQLSNGQVLSATFKNLSIGFLDLANLSYSLTNADNIIRFTEMAGKNIERLKDFEDATNING